MSHQQRSGQAGFSADANGYKVDHRSETESRSQSCETRKLPGGHEVHRQETRTVNLEELKSRETSRIATAEDVRALLEAEFEGIREIQTSREISVEEFNLIESEFRRKLGPKVDCQTRVKEEHKLENVLESPQWKAQFGMPLSTKNEIIDVREATVIEKNYLEPHLSKVATGNVQKTLRAGDPGVLVTTRTEYPEGSLRHEAKHKRHVIEEVFIEGSDKFYEKTKKSRRDETEELDRSSGEAVQMRGGYDDDDDEAREHGKHSTESESTPSAKPRKRRTAQSELVVEDTNLYTDESARHSWFNQDYKIKPMYSDKSKPIAGQDVEKYFKETGSGNFQVKAAAGPQQEIVIGEVKTHREGAMDVDKNRSVDKINQEGPGKSKMFKKRLNQKDIKLLPKMRHKQEEIVINDPTVYDETQFLSLRKAQKKKRLFENTKTLPAKLGKKSKTQLDREVDLILKRSEEIAEGKHSHVVADAPEQVVLDEPDIFREATTTKKKMNISHGSLDKQHKQLEKMERELEARSLGGSEKFKGPQEEIVIDDPEIFRETTLKKKKQEKLSPSKIMKDIMQDIDVLTQEARKNSAEEKIFDQEDLEQQKTQKREILLEDSSIHKENTLREAKVKQDASVKVPSAFKVVDETSVEHVQISQSGDHDSRHQKDAIVDKQDYKKNGDCIDGDRRTIHNATNQNEIVIDDQMLFADHNRPKDIHLEHGRAVQIAEIDDFNLPELENHEAEDSALKNKQEKTEKKSSKPKKFLFKKKKKSQGESVVDESFVYEDAAKIRFPEVSKKGGGETKVTGSSSSKTFWNWNFGQHKAQQEVIKDESHYHEDKHEEVETKLEEGAEVVERSEESSTHGGVTIKPPVNFQDSSVDVDFIETRADLKIVQGASTPLEIPPQESKPVEMKFESSPVLVTKPDVIKVETTQKTQEESAVDGGDVKGIEIKETSLGKSKFKINLPSLTIPKPHLNFGFKKHHKEGAPEEKVAETDAKEKEKSETLTAEVRIDDDNDDDDASKVVRDQEEVVLEESHKTQDGGETSIEEIGHVREARDTQQNKIDSHKTKFHLPSFTIPKPHINFGFKKHQPEAVDVDQTGVVDEETKHEESVQTKNGTKAEDGDLVLSREKAIYKEDVFVEEIHNNVKEGVAAEEQKTSRQVQAEEKTKKDSKVEALSESIEKEDWKKEDEKSHDHKFKINLQHIPRPHLNIHFKKTKDHEEAEETEENKEEEETMDDDKVEKIKVTVPHINLHVPHIHFASLHKQEEVVVDDKSIIPDASKIVVAEENSLKFDAAGKEPKSDSSKLEEWSEKIDETLDKIPETTEMSPKEKKVVTAENGKQHEIVETKEKNAVETIDSCEKEPTNGATTLDGKSKKKMKFNFPHFSLPRSHGKQVESVSEDATVVEDSTKLKIKEKNTEKEVSDETSEEASVDKSVDADKDKKVDQHKFKLRLPKPHFKFGFKSKDKHKTEEQSEKKETTTEVSETSPETKITEVEAPDVSEERKEIPLEFLTQPCADEFTETVKYVLDAGEDKVPAGPVTIRVDPEEYQTIVSKSKQTKEEAKTPVIQVEEDVAPTETQVTVSVPYYEYEPNDKEGETAIWEAVAKEDGKKDADENVHSKKEVKEGETTEAPEKTTEEEAMHKEIAPKSKSKFHLPCIKLKKPFLKKQESSEDDPAYGEVSTEELKEPHKLEEVRQEDANVVEAEDGKSQMEPQEAVKAEKAAKKKHKAFNIKSLGRKSHQGEVVVNDSHIYTDNSTLKRRFLNKFRHKDKVAPESGGFILENNLPESSENRQQVDQPSDEAALASTKQGSLASSNVDRHPDFVASAQQSAAQEQSIRKNDEVSVVMDGTQHDEDTGRELDSSTLGSSTLRHKKQEELIVSGGCIITEPQTSSIHRALHKQHVKSNEQVDKTPSQDLYDPENVAKRKEHGKLTSLFHRSSGEYDLEHQKRTNQPLVELIGSRQKPGELEVSVSTQDENSWSLNYRKNLTLDATNHLTFESEYDPNQSISTENVQLFCPTARRSYRKQVQIDDFDLPRTIEERSNENFKTSTPVKAEAGDGATSGSSAEAQSEAKSAEREAHPVRWTGCTARDTSFFSTLPDFETVDDRQRSPHFVVVAIDFGTTFSGYAFSFKNDVDGIHVMRKWEGGDPGVTNQKTPTTLLLTPDGEFHSFGFTARDFYHDLSPREAKRWLYFEKFKMALHYNADLTSETEIRAANGSPFRAQEVFAHALRFFKNHAVQEISEQTNTELIEEDVKWIITVPAIWKEPAKQFMREAAYKAGIASPCKPDQLLIALEPEAASIFVRKQRLRQLIPEEIDELKDNRKARSNQDLRTETSSPVLLDTIAYQTHLDESSSWSQSVASNALSMSFQRCPSPTSFPVSVGHEIDITDNRFMVADCGGGTVDITVYEMLSATGGKLKELYKASGGPYGSTGVDIEFEKLLVTIFGGDFIEAFKVKRPAGWVDLVMAFESRKRAANPFKTKPLNVSLPFSFIDYYKKFKNATVESAIRKFNSKDIKWSSQGMLRLMPESMNSLFQPTLDNITKAISNVLKQPDVSGVKHIFLVGGFAESPMLQQEVRRNFAHQARILIPSDVSLTILKGAVLYGIDPSVVVIRKSRLTYGLGVLNRFVEGRHPESKKAMKEGVPWCVDVFDHLVYADQSVALGSSVIRSYTPADSNQKFSLFHIYCTESRDVDYVTDEGVVKCGTLRLDLDDHQWELESSPSRPVSQNLQDEANVDGRQGRREIQARLTFGDTEIKIIALDVATGNYVRATLDFLNK